MWKRKEWVINNLFPREIIFMYFYVIWIIIGSDNRVKVQFLSELCVYTTKNNIILTRYYYVLILEDMDLFLEIDRHLFARITSSLMWYSKLFLDLYMYIYIYGTGSSFDPLCKGHRWHSFRQKHFHRYRYSITISEIRQLPLFVYFCNVVESSS